MFRSTKRMFVALAILVASGLLLNLTAPGDYFGKRSWSQEKLGSSGFQLVEQPTEPLTVKSAMVAGPGQVVMPTEDEKEFAWLEQLVSEEQAVVEMEFGGGMGGLKMNGENVWPYTPLTSMTEVCELFPAHVGPTKLFLNFDGYDDAYVSPFVSTTGDRERDIQEIMFAVAQTMAPFNVQVRRFHGNGQHAVSNGHTTIFIGDKLGNTFYWENDSSILVDNNKRAFADADYPCPSRGVFHAPNSDDFNRGYVDPISQLVIDGVEISWETNDNGLIARAICHEAGHTFGIAHVLTGSNPDIMSYSFGNFRAINQEFPLTSLNSQLNGPTVENWDFKPMWWFFQMAGFGGQTQFAQAPLVTQNSFQCLLATLGPRDTSSDYANVANSELVSGAYVDANSESIAKYQMIPSQVENFGDYDVFDLSPETTEYLQVNANALEGDNWFDPIVMVFGDDGNLVAYDDDDGEGKAAKTVFQAVLGHNYKIVVGAQNNNTFGTYQLSVEPPVFQVNPAVGGGSIGGLTKGSSGSRESTQQLAIGN